MTNSSKSVTILMVEDNEDDIIATRRAWKKYNIANTLHVVRDGEECLDFLKRRGKYEDQARSPRPNLILLDVNLPKMNGIDVLRHIRNDDDLKALPVIMLTTSKAENDKLRSYDLGISAYIVKPIGFEKFAGAINTINLFWQLVES